MDCREQTRNLPSFCAERHWIWALAVFTARELRYISEPKGAKKEVLWIIGLGETSRTRVA
ncbi:MAG: hypothetical protein OJF50_000118 [Nitrospira sp.]|nr:hypothetical protein [Nitrospira sp.]